MISRLLLTTAIGLALGTTVLGSSAFAQGAADNQATINTATATPTVTLSDGVTVSQQERARIGESVARMNVKSLRGVDFSVAVGAKVPRELRVHRLPAEATQIVPQYRDYRFLVVEKDIVIVEPKTNKIVTILKPDSAATPTATATNAVPVAPTPVASTPAAPVTAAQAPAHEAPTAATPPTTAPAPVAAAPATPSTATPVTAAPEAPAASAAVAPATAPKAAEQPSAPVRDSAAEAERPKAKKQASRTQRRTVSRAERDEWRRSNAEVRVGQRVPDDVVLYRVPPRYYYQEAPVTREYRDRGYADSWRGRVYRGFD